MKNNKASKAYTLIEILLTITLMSVISAFIFQTYLKKNTIAKADIQIGVITQIETAVNTFASPSNNASFDANLTTANIIAVGMVSPEYVNGGAIQNVFGGQMVISPIDIYGNKGFAVDLTQLPSLACTTIASKEGYRSDSVLINTVVLKAAGSTADIDVANAAQLCSGSSNTLTLIKALRRENTTVTDNSTGNAGLNYSYLVADLHQTARGPSFTGCPAGTTDTGYGCSCPVNTLWDGQTCQVSSARYRQDGVTLGSSNPTTPTSAGIPELIAGTTTGAAGAFNLELQKYLPSYVTLPANSVPGVEGFIISQTSPGGSTGNYLNPLAAKGGCTNGLVWDKVSNGCVTPTFTYFNGTVDTTVAVDAAYDNNKFKTCIVGSRDTGSCIMPTTTVTNAPPTNWRDTVSLPGTTTGGRCINGQVWNKATQLCGCPTNTVMLGGYCQCSVGTSFDATTQTCI